MAGKEYSGLRGAVTVVSAVVYTGSSLAAVPLVWLLASRARAGAVDAAIAWALVLLGLATWLVVWFVIAGLVNLLADQAEEVVRLHRTTRAASDRQAQLLADVVARLDGLTHWTAMSEATRALLVRRREAEVFAMQIEQAISAGEWAEADRLIHLFQDHFHDAALAEQFRQKMAQAREVADDRVVRARISEIRGLMDQHNYPAAELALTRLAGDFPRDGRLDDLRSTLLRARRRFAEQTEERFRQLLAARQVEEASALLDTMTWLEGEPLAEMKGLWKDAFRQAQAEARQAFTAVVKEKQWAKAVELGDQILARFADSSLATEVRKVIDTLRQRAKEPAGPVPAGTAALLEPAAPAAPPAPPSSAS